MSTLFLIRGVPGSGKSTLAKRMKAKLEVTQAVSHNEADQFFVTSNGFKETYTFDSRLHGAAHDECYGRTMRQLNAGHTVIVSNTFSRYRELERYVKGVQRSGLPVKIIVIRCRGRWKSVHGVPEKVISNMLERWESFRGEIDYDWETDNG